MVLFDQENPSMAPSQQQLNLLQAIRPLLHPPVHSVHPQFAQYPARDVLKHLPGDAAEAAVLLLGCADGCCLLAALATAHPGLENLTAVLDDYNPLMLGRAALLLLLASRLDPNSREDMQVLWEVWYCALWTPATLARVKPFIHELQRERAEFAAQLVAGEEQQNNRRALLNQAVEAAVRPDSLELAADALSQALGGVTVKPMKDAKACEGDVTLEGILQQDLATFFDSGYLAPNYTGQKAAKPRSVNVTLLRPSSSTWRLKTMATPVTTWGPFSAAELESAIKSGSPEGVTARLCIARMTEIVRGFQACTVFCSQPAAALASADTGPGQQHADARVRLQVQLVCMDALQLCLSMPLPKATDNAVQMQPPRKQTHKQKSAAPAAAVATAAAAAPLLFDAIDAGTLADEMGMLPLLVAAGARLKPAPHARLYTGAYKWRAWDDNFPDYLCKRMLHMPLSLTPSILGLRLLTDLTLEGPETAEAFDYRYFNFREVMWAPIPAELQASPLPQVDLQLSGGPAGSIEAALQAVATELCCAAREQKHDASTPQLLAWLLASMSQRVDMSSLLVGNDSSSSSSKASKASSSSSGGSTSGTEDSMRLKYSATQRVLWALRRKFSEQLPAYKRLCFITGVDVLRSSLQQNAPLDWQPADVPLCAGVLQLSVPWRLQRVMMAQYPSTRIVLVDVRALSQLAQQFGVSPGVMDVERWFKQGTSLPAGIHMTDMWATESSSTVQWQGNEHDRVYIYLPQDHGLDPAHMLVNLPRLSQTAKMKHLMPGQMIQAPPTLAQVLLPAACPFTAACIPSSPAAQPGDTQPWALRVLSLEESGEWYKATLQLQPSHSNQPAGRSPSLLPENLQVFADGYYLHVGKSSDSSAYTEQRQCSTAHEIVVELCGPAGGVQVQPAELFVRWPVAIGLNEPRWVRPDSYSGASQVVAETIPGEEAISLKLRKAQAWETWPDDEAWQLAPAPLDLAALPPVPERADSLVGNFCLNQYHWKHDMQHGAPKGSHANMTRNLLNRLMMDGSEASHATDNGFTQLNYIVDGGGCTKSAGVYTDEVYITLHPPVLVTPAGRPVLPCTVVDMSMCQGALYTETLQHQELIDLLPKLGFSSEARPATHRLLDSCQIFRRMLSRRARACQPTAAQRLVLPDGGMFPYYYNSYVSSTKSHVFTYPRAQSQPEPAGRMNQATYLKHRLEELLNDTVSRRDCGHMKSVFDEIKKLIEHDGGRTLPVGLVETAQTLLNLWSSHQPLLGSARKASTDEPSPHTQQACGQAAAPAATGPCCAQCGKQSGTLRMCGKCESVRYCSRECQVAHWTEHKQMCKAQLG